MIDDEPDELTVLQLAAARARRRLVEAPGLISWIRLQVIPVMGGKSDGMPRAASKNPPAPLNDTAVVTADETYAQILDWVSYWSHELAEPAPQFVENTWRQANGEPQGYLPGISPEAAGFLMRNLATWLISHEAMITLRKTAAREYFDDVDKILRTAAGRFPRAARRDRGVIGRHCSVCGTWQVHAHWHSEDLLDVTVECEHCGNVIEPKTYRKMLDWIA